MPKRLIRDVWNRHYEPLEGKLRPGCEPRLYLHEGDVQNAVVLVHGLTDSPFYVDAIGRRFHAMGFDVLMPLLPAHGLKAPDGMKGVTPEQWMREVDLISEMAVRLAPRVSIGGLSTGATLGVYKAITAPEMITGGLFLFSAALDLAGPMGNVAETLLRFTPLVKYMADRQDREYPLIGINPYRYARHDYEGAAALARLIGYIEDRYPDQKKYADIIQPLFVAHSDADTVTDIGEVEMLISHHTGGEATTCFYRIPKERGVRHASLVLEKDVLAPHGPLGEPLVLEARNPDFEAMMQCAAKFVQTHLA
jgi:esterase/lipase